MTQVYSWCSCVIKIINYVCVIIVLVMLTRYCTGFNISPVIVDGGWSSWVRGYVSKCLGRCGKTGFQSVRYTRKCDKPTPSPGGLGCHGSPEMKVNWRCAVPPCPVNGKWSRWITTSEGVCSVTCGSHGVMDVTKNRLCNNPPPRFGGRMCEGPDEKVVPKQCFPGRNCPVHGAWSVWIKKRRGICSVTCGDRAGLAYVIRYRLCNNPEPRYGGRTCSGADEMIFREECFSSRKCPVHGGWGVWLDRRRWPCSVTCGRYQGVRNVTKYRSCNKPSPKYGGRKCSGPNEKILQKTCTTETMCPIHGGWGHWIIKATGSCSITCGDSTGFIGITKYRLCNRPTPKYGGRLCDGPSEKMFAEECHSGLECPVDGGWSSWISEVIGDCSATCGNGSRLSSYSRTCDNPVPSSSGLPCPGNTTKTIQESCFKFCIEINQNIKQRSLDILIIVTGSAVTLMLCITGIYIRRQTKCSEPLLSTDGAGETEGEYNYGDETEDSPVDQSDDNPEDNAEDNPADHLEDYPADHSEDHPVETSEDHPAETSEDHPAETSEDHPAETSEDHPVETSEDHPGDGSEDNPRFSSSGEKDQLSVIV